MDALTLLQGGLANSADEAEFHEAGRWCFLPSSFNGSLQDPNLGGHDRSGPLRQLQNFNFESSYLPTPTQGLQEGHDAFLHGPSQASNPLALLPAGSRVPDIGSSGYPLPNTVPSWSGFQESGPPATQRLARSEVDTVGNGSLLTNDNAFVVHRSTPSTNPSVIIPLSTPVPTPTIAEPLNLDQNGGVVGMPNWIALIKPRPQAGENVITLRRDYHFALEIILAYLPVGSLDVCNGIKIPATASVKNFADTTGKTLLEFRIRLYGATTKKPYEVVCEKCQKRDGKRRGIPSLIDFKAEYDVIEPKDGKIRVEFSFCCYPKCHKLGDTEYLLDIVLSVDEGQHHIVAQCRLPLSFHVVPKLPPRQISPPIRPEEEGGDPPAPELLNLQGLMVDTNAFVSRTPSDGQIHHRPPDFGYIQQDHDHGFFRPPPLPNKNGERTPTLTEVNPDSASITGGVRIWLKGMDFPALFPLFARFGAAIVPTTFSASNLLACHLPPRTEPGVINVTLSKQPHPNAPEYGISIARFSYKEDVDELIPILLRIQGQACSPLLQAILNALNDQGKSALDRGTNTHDPIEVQPTYQFGSDFGPALGTWGRVGPPEHPHEWTESIWSAPTNVAGPLTHRPHFGETHSPLVNHGVNPSVPSNPDVLWCRDPDYVPFKYSQDKLSAPSSSKVKRRWLGLAKQKPLSLGTGNDRPRYRARLAHEEGHRASARSIRPARSPLAALPLATHGDSINPYEVSYHPTGTTFQTSMHPQAARPVYSAATVGYGVVGRGTPSPLHSRTVSMATGYASNSQTPLMSATSPPQYPQASPLSLQLSAVPGAGAGLETVRTPIWADPSAQQVYFQQGYPPIHSDSYITTSTSRTTSASASSTQWLGGYVAPTYTAPTPAAYLLAAAPMIGRRRSRSRARAATPPLFQTYGRAGSIVNESGASSTSNQASQIRNNASDEDLDFGVFAFKDVFGAIVDPSALLSQPPSGLVAVIPNMPTGLSSHQGSVPPVPLPIILGETDGYVRFCDEMGALDTLPDLQAVGARAHALAESESTEKRKRTRRRRNVGDARGASRARSPLEPDEAGQDSSIYAVAARHSPVDMGSGAPGPGGEESGSFAHGPSVFGSSILLNQPAQVTNVAILPEQQPHSYYPYFPSPSGRRSPSPGEAHPSSTRVLLNGSNTPPAYFSASHPYSRKTPSPVFAGPLVSVPDSPTNHIGYLRGAPPSACSGAIFGDSKQPSSEGHGSSMENKRGPGLESMDAPSGNAALPPMVAYAYEPEPVTWNHRIVGGSLVGDTRDHTSSPSPTVEEQASPGRATRNRKKLGRRSRQGTLARSSYLQAGEVLPLRIPSLDSLSIVDNIEVPPMHAVFEEMEETDMLEYRSAIVPKRKERAMSQHVGRSAHAVARSESTDDHSPTAEDKAHRDAKDAGRATLKERRQRTTAPEDNAPRQRLKTTLLRFSRRLSSLARIGSDPITIRGKSTPVEVDYQIGQSPPIIVRTPHGPKAFGTRSDGLAPTHSSGHTGAVNTPIWCSGPSFVSPPEISIVTNTALDPRGNEGDIAEVNARSTHRNHDSVKREDPIETGLVAALSCLQGRSNFREIVSTTNDWGQTLAHLSTIYGYPSLLSRLVDWRINLTIADVNGLTALHYAHMKGDLDSVRILRKGGASEFVKDKLGRTPLDLQPEGFSSSIDVLDAKTAVG